MPSEMKRLTPARGGERQAEEDRRRSVARQGDAAGRHPPKTMRPARKRQMVDHARATWQVSIRRACRALPVDRSTYHYRSRRAGQADLTERIKEIAETRVRYGYRRIHVLLRREGWLVNAKRVYRLYREMGLQLRNKTPKRRVKAKLRRRSAAGDASERDLGDGLRPRPAGHRPQAARADDRRYVHAVLAGDRASVQLPRRRCRRSARAGWRRQSATRKRSASIRAPSSSHAISICGPISVASRSTSAGQASRPTTPSSKSFNGKFRAECLNANWFMSLDDARRKCEAWRRDYNEVRPHSAIGNKCPIELINRSAARGPP